MNNDVEAKRKLDMEAFEKEIASVSQELPGYEHKEYTFSGLERQMLAQQATIVALAEQAQNIMINQQVMKRLGIEPNENMRIRYSVGLGRFVVFSPKEKNH